MKDAIAHAWALQRGTMLYWQVISYACGIGVFFALRVEPSVWVLALPAAAFGVVSLAVMGRDWRGWVFVTAFAAYGFAAAGLSAHLAAAPVLGFRYYGPVEGRIVEIDKSQSDAVRLTLDHVVLAWMDPQRTPERVRVSLHGDQRWIDPKPGVYVGMTAHLSPPSGPIEPYGFDFRRSAWFDRLGAVGYTRTPALALREGEGAGLGLYRFRQSVAAWLRARMDGEAGDVAAALIVGDRSGLDPQTLEDLRATNLAHLLAISGLHMGLLTGLVFGALRLLLVVLPWVPPEWSAKKGAAIGALAVGALYLAVSGANVATQRAFVMVALVFGAMLLDRRALTLRTVAIAGLIVLTLSPVALTGPGFQMSFAATTALVAVFAEANGRLRRVNRLLRWPLTLLTSSLVAGLATAPFGAAHFNMVSHYGLVANLVSVPLMGVVIMPAALAAFVLLPFGAEGLALAVMTAGIDWILGVAHHVAGLEGATSGVIAPMPWVLPLIGVGGLLLLVIRGPLRGIGLVPLLVAALLWAKTERPALLISDTGGLIGVLGPEGRALNKARGDGFAAEGWLENDGMPRAQEEAPLIAQERERFWRVGVGATEVLLVSGKTALLALEGCGGAQILVSNQRDSADRPCRVFDQRALSETGALAISGSGVLTSVREISGERLWTSRSGSDRQDGPEP